MLKVFTRLRTLIRNLCTIVSDGFRFFVGVWRRRTALAAENLLLRKQLALFREREKRAMPTIPADRFVFCKLARWFDRRGALMIVKPATLIGWHRSVPDATLATDRSSRFVHCRGVDCQRSETLSGLILPGSVHPKSGDRGIASKANGLWMTQIGRNATDAVDGILNGKRYLIHDRDPLFTTEFQCILARIGVNAIKLPPQSPNLNAYCGSRKRRRH